MLVWPLLTGFKTPELFLHEPAPQSISFGALTVFPVAQKVKNPPTVQETWVRSLGREDPLEEGVATHSSVLGWGILWTEEPDRLQSIGLQRVRHNWSDLTCVYTYNRYFMFRNSNIVLNFQKILKSFYTFLVHLFQSNHLATDKPTKHN